MPPKRTAEEALAIVRSLKERYLTPEIAEGAERGRERLRQLRQGEAMSPAKDPAGTADPAAPTASATPEPPAAEPPAAEPEPEFTQAEREKARAVLAAIRRRLHSNGRKPVGSSVAEKPAPWRPKA